MVICLDLGADLHMAQLMPLPLTVFCFSKIQIGFTFLVPAHLGSPGQRAVKRACVSFPYTMRTARFWTDSSVVRRALRLASGAARSRVASELVGR